MKRRKVVFVRDIYNEKMGWRKFYQLRNLVILIAGFLAGLVLGVDIGARIP